MRRAFLDRARYGADPDFVDVPVKRLTSNAYADELRIGLDTLHASSSVALGRDIVTDTASTESNETTHFSVVDDEGIAVSNTFTLEQWYGSSVVVPGTGILLNNEMGDFNKRPGFTSVNRHRHEAQSDRARQANALVDDADHRAARRQGRAGDRFARGAGPSRTRCSTSC